MDMAYNNGADAVESLLANDWLPAMTQQAEDAVTYTKAGKTRKRLSRLDASRMAITAPPVDQLTAILTDAARNGMHGAVAELAAQGLDVSTLTDDALSALVKDQAAAVAQQTADGVRLAASRRAVQVNAGRSPSEVAREVGDYLRGLAHTWESDQLRGAVQMATNVSRLAIFAQVQQGASLLSSELLDANTCGPCEAIDGTEFADMAEATRFYPSGGMIDCQGGPRCRGTVVLVLAESDIAPGTPAHLGAG